MRLAMVCADRETGTPLAAALFAKTLEYHQQYVTELVDIGRALRGPAFEFDDAVVPALDKGLAVPESECKVWNRQAYCHAWGLKGEACLDKAEYDVASTAIDKALTYFQPDSSMSHDPVCGYIWGLKGKALIGKSDYEHAVPALQKAISIQPGAAYLRVFLGMAIAGKGDDAGARKAF